MFSFPELPAFLDRSRPEVASAVAKANAKAEVQAFFIKNDVMTRGKYVVDVLPPLPGAKAKPRTTAKVGRKRKARKTKH